MIYFNPKKLTYLLHLLLHLPEF